MISWLLGIDENLSPLPLRDVFDKLLQGKHFISDHSTLDLPVLTPTLLLSPRASDRVTRLGKEEQVLNRMKISKMFAFNS